MWADAGGQRLGGRPDTGLVTHRGTDVATGTEPLRRHRQVRRANGKRARRAIEIGHIRQKTQAGRRRQNQGRSIGQTGGGHIDPAASGVVLPDPFRTGIGGVGNNRETADVGGGIGPTGNRRTVVLPGIGSVGPLVVGVVLEGACEQARHGRPGRAGMVLGCRSQAGGTDSGAIVHVRDADADDAAGGIPCPRGTGQSASSRAAIGPQVFGVGRMGAGRNRDAIVSDMYRQRSRRAMKVGGGDKANIATRGKNQRRRGGQPRSRDRDPAPHAIRNLPGALGGGVTARSDDGDVGNRGRGIATADAADAVGEPRLEVGCIGIAEASGQGRQQSRSWCGIVFTDGCECHIGGRAGLVIDRRNHDIEPITVALIGPAAGQRSVCGTDFDRRHAR